MTVETLIQDLLPTVTEEPSVSKILKAIDVELIQKIPVRDILVQQLLKFIDPLLIKLEPSDAFET